MATAWKDQPTTLEEIEALPGEMLTCTQIARVVGADPQTIHLQATLRPDMLGFPVTVMGKRVKIPKRAFIKFMTEGWQVYD